MSVVMAATRSFCVVVLLYVSVQHGVVLSSDTSAWQGELLTGLTDFPNPDVAVGTLVVWGDNAVPVFTLQQPYEVIFAAAAVGKGRVAVLSSENFLQRFSASDADYSQLYQNVQTWLKAGAAGSTAVLPVSAYTGQEVAILTWDGRDVTSEQVAKAVEAVKEQGKGLIIAVNPDRWRRNHTNNDQSEIPFYDFLQDAGIAFSTHTVLDYIKNFKLDENLAKYAHVLKALIELETKSLYWNIAWRLLDGSQPYLPAEKASKFKQIRDAMKTERNSWRQEILEGVTSIAKLGSPGNMVVFEETVEVLFTDDAGDKNVIAVAAEFGKGRFVAFTSYDYADTFYKMDNDKLTQLNNNIRKWVSRGNSTDVNDGIKYYNGNYKTIDTTAKIIAVRKGHVDMAPALTEYVRKGGALVYGIKPYSTYSKNRFPDIFYGAGFINVWGKSGQSGDYTVTNNPANSRNFGSVLANEVETNGTGEIIYNMNNVMDEFDTYVVRRISPKASTLMSRYASLIYTKPMPSPGNVGLFKPPQSNSLYNAYASYSYLHKYGVEYVGKAPGIDVFPGDVTEPAPRLRANVRINSPLEDRYSTGYYLKAGEVMGLEIKSLSGGDAEDWYVLIGAHTDNLLNKDEWERWPLVYKKKKFNGNRLSVSSPFGGLVYLISDKSSHMTLTVELLNVIEAPRFDLTDPILADVNTWRTRRNATGIWADIVGEYVTITMPSSSVRGIDDPTIVMQNWDKLAHKYHYLRGSDIRASKREQFVTDQQPSAGYMHTGHPIVTHLDVANPSNKNFLLGNEGITTGVMWGAFHEIGHNMQRNWWTFNEGSQVTVNIFTVYGMQTIGNQEAQMRHPTKVEAYLTGDEFTLDKWQGSSSSVGLGFYMQLAEAFGWDSYKSVFRQYEEPDSVKPSTEEEEINMWFTRFSKTVNFNIAPIYFFWGIPYSDEAYQQVATLPLILPEDRYTAIAPGRTNATLDKFPTATRAAVKLSLNMTEVFTLPVMEQPLTKLISVSQL